MCTNMIGNEDEKKSGLGMLACCPVYGVYERLARRCPNEETLADLQKAIGTCPAVCPEPDSELAVSAAGASKAIGR